LERQLLEVLQGLRLDLDMDDGWVWKDNEFSTYTVNSAYVLLRGKPEGGINTGFVKFRKTKALHSAQVTAWKVLVNKLATKGNFVRRGVKLENGLCSMCGVEEESCRHLFFECKIAWFVWSQCYAWLCLASVDHSDAFFHFLQFRMCNAYEFVNAIWGTIWTAIISEIWRLGNKVLFKGGMVDAS